MRPLPLACVALLLLLAGSTQAVPSFHRTDPRGDTQTYLHATGAPVPPHILACHDRSVDILGVAADGRVWYGDYVVGTLELASLDGPRECADAGPIAARWTVTFQRRSGAVLALEDTLRFEAARDELGLRMCSRILFHDGPQSACLGSSQRIGSALTWVLPPAGWALMPDGTLRIYDLRGTSYQVAATAEAYATGPLGLRVADDAEGDVLDL